MEGLPNSLCEAMLCECIPIGSAYFGTPSAIGDTGLIFNHSNSIQSVVEFILDPNNTNLPHRARQRIIGRFNVNLRKQKFKKRDNNMKTGVVGSLNTNNIGDYIQTLAVIKLVGEDYKILDRESLAAYIDKPRKIIINGWFMENPLNFPPSINLKPLFISFHLNPSVSHKFLNKNTVNYLKEHQPIGCRDKHTQDILEKNNIKTFLSSCVTLTLKKKRFHNDLL